MTTSVTRLVFHNTTPDLQDQDQFFGLRPVFSPGRRSQTTSLEFSRWTFPVWCWATLVLLATTPETWLSPPDCVSHLYTRDLQCVLNAVHHYLRQGGCVFNWVMSVCLLTGLLKKSTDHIFMKFSRIVGRKPATNLLDSEWPWPKVKVARGQNVKIVFCI